MVAAAVWGRADLLLTDDAALHDEVISSGIIDAQRMPVFLAYAIDSAPGAAQSALVEMARRRWLRDPSAHDEDVLERLRGYFDRNGWPTDALSR